MEILDRNKLEAQRKFLKIYKLSLKKKNQQLLSGSWTGFENASLKQWL